MDIIFQHIFVLHLQEQEIHIQTLIHIENISNAIQTLFFFLFQKRYELKDRALQ